MILSCCSFWFFMSFSMAYFCRSSFIATTSATAAALEGQQQVNIAKNTDLSCSQGEENEDGRIFLEQARSLTAPIPNMALYGENEGSEFWQTHASLLRKAWNHWEHEQQQEQKLPPLTREHLDSHLRAVVESAWNHSCGGVDESDDERPQSIVQQQRRQTLLLHQDEERLRKLWKPVAPGVYACQFFNPFKITDLRWYLDTIIPQSSIPTRRPNGMNRYGYILEPSIDGAVPLTPLTHFYQYLVQDYIRPIGRLLFADYVGGGDRRRIQGNEEQEDGESYAFTIRYQEGEDVALSEHSDASLYTLNVNLNLPPEQGIVLNQAEDFYEGSSLYFVEEVQELNSAPGATKNTSHFYDQHHRLYHNFSFKPGMAVLHRGITRHAALPISRGERTNLIVWLFGRDGYVRIAPYTNPADQLTSIQRWIKNKK